MNKLSKLGCLMLSVYVSSSFAVESGKALIVDAVNGNRSVTYENIDGYAVIEGDIIIGTVADVEKKGAVIIKGQNTRWPNGKVPYIINSAMPNKNRTYIQQAIDSIEKSTVGVDFVAVSSKSLPKDYIEFMPSKSTCSSYVGRIGGRQVISLAPGCYTGGTIHEMTHALGFWHEQARSDRDGYVKIVWDNISDSAKGNFAIISSGQLVGTYDYGSIMHYGPKAFSKNGKDTIIPLQSGVTIGQRDGLSTKDVAALNSMYPKK